VDLPGLSADRPGSAKPVGLSDEGANVARLFIVMGLVVALPSLASAVVMFLYPGPHDGLRWYFVLTTLLGFGAVAAARPIGRRVR
jgi:hypothetical protein